MINTRRHTQKVICYLMLHHGIIGCTNLSEDTTILKYCEDLLMQELDVKKRSKVLRNADSVTRKMFDQVKDHSGNDIIAAICLTLNDLNNQGFEIFNQDEPIADIFDNIVAKCNLTVDASTISEKWLEILKPSFN